MSENVRIEACEYVYCKACKTIRYAFELEPARHGINCQICGGQDLQAPRWVYCPHRKSVVKCVIGGRALVTSKAGYECQDRYRCLMRSQTQYTKPSV